MESIPNSKKIKPNQINAFREIIPNCTRLNSRLALVMACRVEHRVRKHEKSSNAHVHRRRAPQKNATISRKQRILTFCGFSPFQALKIHGQGGQNTWTRGPKCIDTGVKMHRQNDENEKKSPKCIDKMTGKQGHLPQMHRHFPQIEGQKFQKSRQMWFVPRNKIKPTCPPFSPTIRQPVETSF